MAVVATVAAAASAQAGTGGVAYDGGDSSTAGEPGECEDPTFGDRTLRLGDCGNDVKTLNWIMKARSYEAGIDTNQQFEDPTDATVREFQRRKDLDVDGVVGSGTHREIVRGMKKQRATWYGPGFWGNRTACGQRLRRRTVGVAHRKLPCGTKVTFKYKDDYLRTKVIDRGPYANGADWDLTRKAARKLDFTSTDDLRRAVIRD